MNYQAIIFLFLAAASVNYTQFALSMQPNNRQMQKNTEELFKASENGAITLASRFIRRGADVNGKDLTGSTPMHAASINGRLDIIKLLVKNKADVNAKDYYSHTPIVGACQQGNLSIVEFLITHNAFIDSQDFLGSTPLHHVSHKGNAQIAKLLIMHGANIEATNKQLLTPLHAASEYGKLKVVELLIEKKANKEAASNEQVTPLHFSCKNGHLDVTKMLIADGANIEAKSYNHLTPLHYACKTGYLASVEYLIAKGANINVSGLCQWTPLHFAAECGNVLMVKLLIENGAFVNSTTIDGFTPLHLATAYGHMEVCQLLLKADANIKVKANGLTALDYAYDKKNSAIIELFTQHGMPVISDEQSELNTQAFFLELNKKQEHEPELQKSIDVGKNFKRNQKRKLKAQQKKELDLAVVDQANTQITDVQIADDCSVAEQSVENISSVSPIHEEFSDSIATPEKDTQVTPVAAKKIATKTLSRKVEKKSSKPQTESLAPVKVNQQTRINQYRVLMDKNFEWPKSLRPKQEEEILSRLKEFKYWPVEGLDITQLKGNTELFRLRVGGYRILFSVDKTKLEIKIHEIALRKNVYKNMKFNLQ